MTDQQFLSWWSSLFHSLPPGTSVQHWSAASGLLPGAFVSNAVEKSYVRIEGPRNKISQRLVPADDFRKILDVWSDYNNQIMPRQDIVRMTKHPTYVVSIIHWREDNSK